MKGILILGLLLITRCSFPEDPANTYQDAQSTSLKIGVSSNPPFTHFNQGKPTGTEIQLLKDFAKTRNLKILYVKGSESELIKKLKNYEVHILAGGFEKKTIWKKDAGTTVTYDKDHVFLIPKGENRLLKELETYIFQNLKKS